MMLSAMEIQTAYAAAQQEDDMLGAQRFVPEAYERP